jgi:hypothetical protein
MRERSWLAARRVAPFTAAAVTGFIIWTHVTASTAFFLNVIELLAVLAAIAAAWLVYEHREGFAFAASAVTIAACVVSIFVDLYPNVMVSSTNHAYNLTVYNTASGAYSLKNSFATAWRCRGMRQPGPLPLSAGAGWRAAGVFRRDRAAAGGAEGAQLCWRAARRHRFRLDRSRPCLSLVPEPFAG